ncbi:hypothetical protein BP6252_00826 [Coleophoma cylindrospora]|uniref:Class II aldolase/adducin N-terminal domain-containing protein n=1 Tax=Coleophoma cylindrospora TaxID=1849047 RepID=A0A3D8SRE7_9HELO|nr:hypothetical protein BP6252_00826 [Coleophoma cylindrospora]
MAVGLLTHPQVRSMLITANHILHYNKVLDAYGHISVRHPYDPNVFIMSASVAPALVSCFEDLIEYHVADASPVEPDARKGFQERFIHSEVYKRFPEINSVVHSHSEAVLPYTMNGVPLHPAFHVAGFLGTHTPVWDISALYHPGDQMDMLVNSIAFGSSLAAAFSADEVQAHKHDHNVVLMANHGFSTVGRDIQQAVYRAIYTTVNASVLSNAIQLRNAFTASGQPTAELRCLTSEQTIGTMKFNDNSQSRPWELWSREVEACPLYVHQESQARGEEAVSKHRSGAQKNS